MTDSYVKKLKAFPPQAQASVTNCQPSHFDEIKSPEIFHHLDAKSFIIAITATLPKNASLLSLQSLTLVALSAFSNLPGHVAIVPVSG